MTRPLPKVRQEAGYSLKRRTVTWFKRRFGTLLVKSQELHFVTINGHRFKRLTLRDSFLASEITRQLEAFGPSDLVPELVTSHENEVWVQFVEGDRPAAIDELLLSKMAKLFATIYNREAKQVALADLPYMARISQDLRFLNQVGVLNDTTRAELQAFANRTAPEKVWIGFDYIDPVLKNFVIKKADGNLCAIDVESLATDQLIGTGVAKACVHWLQPHREPFLSQLTEAGAPDIRPYFAFVDLAFLSDWTTAKVLTGKRRFVRPELFERFLR